MSSTLAGLAWPVLSSRDRVRCRQVAKLLAQDAPTLFEKEGTVDLEVAEVSEDGMRYLSRHSPASR